MFEAGGVYRFSYLWSWQEKRGEESGRKIRPVCLILKSPDPGGALFLFPITTAQPDEGRFALPIPLAERKSIGLQKPCWIVLDEYNKAAESSTYDFESIEPIGRFSEQFFQAVLAAIKSAAPEIRIRAVNRT